MAKDKDKDIKATETSSGGNETMSTGVAEDSKVVFKSRYAKHTLNFDGVPRIEFTPVSSKDANQGGVFETSNQRQIDALRRCEDVNRGVIKEVK